MADSPNGNGTSSPGPATNGAASGMSGTSSGMSSGMTGASAATTPAADDRKLQGVSRSLIIGVGGTGHKIMLDLRRNS